MSLKLFIKRKLDLGKALTFVRCFSQNSITVDKSDSFFITTPIFYVNSAPHLGHFYTLCLADASARYQKLIGINDTIFSTGTDEHGLKIQQAARYQGMQPATLCDSIYPLFKELCDSTNITYTDFIRTTEERHKKVAQLFFENLKSNDFLYKGNYEGWYSVSDEAFISEIQVKEEVLSSGNIKHVNIENGNPVYWTSEINYMFKMSKVKDDLIYWLNNNSIITPKLFHKQALLIASVDLPDLSISRSKDRLSWGIPVPDDDSQTLYVWFEALLNYLTVAGYPNVKMWPPNCQVLGKDILKFHAIYWPALLLAAGVEPPKQLVVHSHWTLEGYKMSKSKGNVVCPFQIINILTSDAFRYYLLRTGVLHSDGNWCLKHAISIINAELANTLGNLFSRCVGKNLNPNQVLPSFCQDSVTSKSQTVLTSIDELPAKIEEHFSSYNINRGIDAIMEMLRLSNTFIQEEEPWKMKNPIDRTKLNSVLHIGIISCQAAAIALQPVVPSLAKNMLDSLNVPVQFRRLKNIHSLSYENSSRKLGKCSPFFKRIVF